MVDLRPIRGREQDGVRPALILSVNKFNHGPADLVIVLAHDDETEEHPDARAGAEG